ncbi:LysR family transcriptional regulator [Kribbella sandramycini]|uniref:DNA-binding transcriptional LysR family regulator n=1 Tax=Kribbella sandramycini TaxID=60450 RepID=A0A7Y4P4K1_9ACTN|nr:LysR family transcriptional regulator [Kribbella sandramycini]MBB6570429.1 DNA-binding transcriptional LysR family regulator [Kribbella sandramycini]NOL45289.1 LysR family transcriptional regulator [Kribbella sandramycini]
MLDLHRLRLLREVHDRGTIHSAARALGYTPSAISQQLSVLEREAGTPLFERVGRNIRLTAAGEVLVRHASTLLAGVEAAEAELATVAAGRLAGVVRVAAFQSAFLSIVAPAIRALAATHPDIRVEAAEAEVEQAAPALRLQQLDVMVGDEYDGQPRAVHADLLREHLLREQIRVVLPLDHPEAGAERVQIARLGDVAWACCQPGTGHREMQVRVCRELGGFEPDLRYSSDDFLILFELVRRNGAAALLPDLVLAHGAPGVAVRLPAEGSVGRTVFMLTRRTRTPTVTAVADALRAAAATSL